MTASLPAPIDILILSNGPGELVTWVKPTVRALRQQLGNDCAQVRISVVLSPCPNASGNEMIIARSYGEVDRVQAAADFFPFLLFARTRDHWDWRSQGIVLFLGGDQLFPVVIGRRLGYKIVIYSEWDARWLGWVDRFAVMHPSIIEQAAPRFHPKFAVVGDLMAEVGELLEPVAIEHAEELVGLLPGSKRAKLMQGVPMMLAVADRVQAVRPQTKFVMPVAPTLSLEELASYAHPENNPAFELVQGVAAQLIAGDTPYLETLSGTRVWLHQTVGDRIPPYGLLKQCQICLTTIGANTAELGALAVPMVVLLPTNQWDAMRAWNGVPGILANLPGVGTLFAKLINQWASRRLGLLAWPNKWAGKQIVPELLGKLYPATIADLLIDYLEHPAQLEAMRQALQAARGEPGAAAKLATIVVNLLQSPPPHQQ
jgi:lipid-A-disaccharide synthase